MSFTDLIAKQPLILISLGGVLLPLVIALLMVLVRVIGAFIARQRVAAAARREKREVEARQKAAELAQQRARLHQIRAARARAARVLEAASDMDETDAFDPLEDTLIGGAVIQRAKIAPSVPVAPEAIATPAADAVPAESAAPEPALAATSDATGGVQDILNSVFVDDEANQRIEMLLNSTTHVPIDDLAAFAAQIARSLGDRAAS